MGKSTHAGIPWLKWLRDELGDAFHFWSFDGWAPPAGKASRGVPAACFDPPLTPAERAVAALEGWILGIR